MRTPSPAPHHRGFAGLAKPVSQRFDLCFRLFHGTGRAFWVALSPAKDAAPLRKPPYRLGETIVKGFLMGAALACAVSLVATEAQAQTAYYKGKQINLYTSSREGGGYTVYAHLLERHMEKVI